MSNRADDTYSTWRDSWTGHKKFNLKEPYLERKPGLSIVVPVYNERENLEQLLDEVCSAGESLGIDWELTIIFHRAWENSLRASDWPSGCGL